MKQHLFKSGSGFSFFLVSIIVILIFMSGYFYRQKNLYKYENRGLIIQNDSIISVNMELKDTLRNTAANKNVSQQVKSNK